MLCSSPICFAARVGTRDKKHFFVGMHSERKRDDLFRVYERVSALADIQFALCVEVGTDCFLCVCELRPRENEVHIHDDFVTPPQPVGVGTDGYGEIAQNALYFRLFVEFFGFKFVVEFDNLHRLDVQGRSRCRLVVNQSAYRAFEFALYGNDVSVAAHGNYAVLQILVIRGRRYERLQFRLDAFAQSAYALTYGFEFGRGVVGDFRFGDERVENALFQFLFEIKTRRHFRKSRNFGNGRNRFGQSARHAQRAPDFEQFGNGEHGALFGFNEDFLDVVNGKRGIDGKVEQHSVRFRRHIQRVAALFERGERHVRERTLLSALGLGKLCQHFEDFAVFQRF